MEEGDPHADEGPGPFRKLVCEHKDKFSSAVSNWNSAALASSGKIMIVVSDDLVPPRGWDQLVRAAAGNLDPAAHRFVVKVTDSLDAADTLVRHPIVSRRHYEDLGLFRGVFSSMYCDNDFTLRAFFNSRILDARRIIFTHEHPSIDNFQETESHRRNNRPEEYEKGHAQFRKLWPPFIKPELARRLPLRDTKTRTSIGLYAVRTGILFSSLQRHLVLTFQRHFRVEPGREN